MTETLPFIPEQRVVLRTVQETIPDSPLPFRAIAQKSGLEEEAVITLLQWLKNEGHIRRFGATLRHQEAGYDCNVMVAWRVEPEEAVDDVAGRMTRRSEITHCYLRQCHPDWPFNLYTMVHGRTEEECRKVISELAELDGVKDYELLFSEGELKKTSMRYF